MKLSNKWLVCILACCLALPIFAQSPEQMVKDYEWPTDQKVLDKLSQWRDLKFGVMFHWGLYSVPGILESWVLCGEDANWIVKQRRSDLSYEEYKRWYWGHSKVFNPTQFDPEQWADLMQKGGMKYMIFTTKHHEGFCMFDTKETDFSIMNGPFGKNPKANITKHVFNAFRDKGFMIGAYFSKPDWHSEYYWWPFFPTSDRNVNYKIKQHPERWEKFRQFTYNQVNELTNGDYGNIDILWLDGAQVDPKWYGQDVQVDKFVTKARETQPGMLAVDRLATGKNENYLTPEGVIPKVQLDVPWETCMPVGSGWGWRKNNTSYKSSKRLITTLIQVVAKGGNYLVSIGPTPEGTIDKESTERVLAVGKWLEKNGKGIYKTVNAKHYNDGKVWFTADKDGETLYAFYTLTDADNEVPETIEWTTNIPLKKKVTLLSNGKRVKCEVNGDKVKIHLPKNIDRSESLGFSFKIK